jgi:hypothetical protein
VSNGEQVYLYIGSSQFRCQAFSPDRLNQNPQGSNGPLPIGSSHEAQPPGGLGPIRMLKVGRRPMEAAGIPEPCGYQGVACDARSPVSTQGMERTGRSARTEENPAPRLSREHGARSKGTQSIQQLEEELIERQICCHSTPSRTRHVLCWWVNY